ncbi:hypothetical protein H6P81_004837 [Aristolochia fimbriata]|uniref:Uncharacterized protein n=1 Tax=Aristolochia fimbriata TaxID=158543 RepID=A0AAV7ETA4_ARIFI|nr:hypothetical protein H6P81_004837 [Aristolochia fimbriata]
MASHQYDLTRKMAESTVRKNFLDTGLVTSGSKTLSKWKSGRGAEQHLHALVPWVRVVRHHKAILPESEQLGIKVGGGTGNPSLRSGGPPYSRSRLLQPVPLGEKHKTFSQDPEGYNGGQFFFAAAYSDRPLFTAGHPLLIPIDTDVETGEYSASGPLMQTTPSMRPFVFLYYSKRLIFIALPPHV